MAAFYANNVRGFLEHSDDNILASLLRGTEQDAFRQMEVASIAAWKDEISNLRQCFEGIGAEVCDEWGVLLEFSIPRRQKRADVVLLIRSTIVVLEFKTSEATAAAIQQVEDYALDLSSFHSGSHGRHIHPIVVAGRLTEGSPRPAFDSVAAPRTCSPSQLAAVLREISSGDRTSQIEFREWNTAPYHPVPTIIDAAVAIFSGMEVREIANAHADPGNLTTTVDRIVDIVEHARTHDTRCICFVTGVPGSGKTLAGLRAVHDSRIRELSGSDPAFFSGNGPLVKILREALVQDAVRRGNKRGDAVRRIYTMVQNVHILARQVFDDDLKRAPHERIVVFDEAQRAWSAEKNRKKFKRELSEPEMIMQIMERHKGWAVVVCLVGGGQEIHDGEAGLAEWGKALRERCQTWKIYAAPEAIDGGPSVAGNTLFEEPHQWAQVERDEALHLHLSTRSYSASYLNSWVNAVLDSNLEQAICNAHQDDFRVWLTRDKHALRSWLGLRARGFDRVGLVASSGATRLRPEGFETSTSFHRDYPYEKWFLNNKDDVRSSYQLEVVATEFEIQGLELDWVGLCWGGDLIRSEGDSNWTYRNFVGTKWKAVKSKSDQLYLKNKYRVLMTRARQGTIIWVPRGENSDPTRDPTLFDDTATFLIECGARPL